MRNYFVKSDVEKFRLVFPLAAPITAWIRRDVTSALALLKSPPISIKTPT
jgi:hypothetical protein